MDQKETQNEATGAVPDYESMGLSQRARETFKSTPEINEHFAKFFMNGYDAEKNPQGIIPFGLAENFMAVEILRPKLEAIASGPDERWSYFYGPPSGEYSLKLAIKKFIEHNFNPLHELDIESIFVLNGATTTLENYAFAFADPGEYIMVPKPCYFMIPFDFKERACVNVLMVNQPNPSDPNERYPLDVAALEKAYLEAKEEGKIVRAIHITHPNNPTGDMYTRQELEELLQFADRYKLHVIANEYYSLSVFGQDTEFTSFLSIPHPDPTRVHYIWGISKDLGLSGFRLAVTMTSNPGVATYLEQVSAYSQVTGTSQVRLTKLLNDLDYFDNEFKPEIKKRMLARYKNVREAIEGCGGRVRESPCTIFRWLDLRTFLPSPDWEGEYQLFQRLISEGVFMISGKFFDHVIPGWFRMVAATEDHIHSTGMERLVRVLKTIRAEKEQQEKV